MGFHVTLWFTIWLASASTWNSGNAQQGIDEVISRNKPATQSSTYIHMRGPMQASLSNDGNYLQRVGVTTDTIRCSATLDTAQPWWKVDLQGSYDISQVKIWNRLDCCSDRLVPLVIEVSSDDTTWQQCATLYELGSVRPGIYTLPCNATGRYVRLTVKKKTYLNVCEVEVYGVRTATHGNWGAWGPWSPCVQNGAKFSRYRLRECNSPAPSNGGENCVGDKSEVLICPVNGNWGSWGAWSRCTASGTKFFQERSRQCNNPAPADGGKDCAGHQREVFICAVHGNWGAWGAWSPCTASGTKFSQERSRQCNNPAPADGGEDCAGHQSEVFICAGVMKEIARGKPATQSSTSVYSSTVVNAASLANDGNYNTSTHNRAVCAHTLCNEANPWWMVDLQGENLVDHVKIWNRGDGFGERLNSLVVEVKLTDGSWHQCAALPPGAATTGSIHQLPCRITSGGDQAVRATSVRLRLSKATPECLQLCEVEIHGSEVYAREGMEMEENAP